MSNYYKNIRLSTYVLVKLLKTKVYVQYFFFSYIFLLLTFIFYMITEQMLYNLLYPYVCPNMIILLPSLSLSFFQLSVFYIFFGSGGLSGEMLLVNIVENNKIDALLTAG